MDVLNRERRRTSRWEGLQLSCVGQKKFRSIAKFFGEQPATKNKKGNNFVLFYLRIKRNAMK